jgi:hypothetical protein
VKHSRGGHIGNERSLTTSNSDLLAAAQILLEVCDVVMFLRAQ